MSEKPDHQCSAIPVNLNAMGDAVMERLRRAEDMERWMTFFIGGEWRAHRKAVGTEQCAAGCLTCSHLFEAGKAAGLILTVQSKRLECTRCKGPASDEVPESTRMEGLLLCKACLRGGDLKDVLTRELGLFKRQAKGARQLLSAMSELLRNPVGDVRSRHAQIMAEAEALFSLTADGPQASTDPAPATAA